MIFDCFIFFNELELLEIRLNELDGVVDKFVLVEAARTFTNKPKPLYFEENKARFSNFLHKIIHITADNYPEYDTPWTYEIHQRNSIMHGLQKCNPDDIIIISDIDEIPSAEAVLNAVKKNGLKILKQKQYYYFLNRQCIEMPFWYEGSRILKYKDFVKKTPQNIRRSRFGKIIDNGGWHFSFLGGAERVKYKLESFAHHEYGSGKYTDIDHISEKIKKGDDLFDRRIFFGLKKFFGRRDVLGKKITYKTVPIDDTFPLFVRTNSDKLASLISEN